MSVVAVENPATSSRHSPTRRRYSPHEFATPVLLLVALCLGGGSTVGLAYDGWLSAIAIIPIALLLAAHLTGVRPLHRSAWWLIGLVGGVALLAAAQLAVSSTSLWWDDPSRAIAADALRQAGLPVEGPLSLTPADTRLFILRWAMPTALLLSVAGATIRERRRTVALIAMAAVVAAALTIAQAFEPRLLPFRTPTGEGAGWFANSNHHGLFLACGLAALIVMLPRRAATAHRRARTFEQIRPLMIAALGVLTIGMAVLMTGSRAALPLFIVALVLAFLARPRHRERPVPWMLALVIMPVALILALLIPRYYQIAFVGPSLSDDPRWNALPFIVEAAREALPWGTGFGSFGDHYRTIEPLELLGGNALNEAHLDALQWVLEGGLPALLLLLAFAMLLAMKGRARLLDKEVADASTLRAGAIMFLLIGAHSLIDYPMRTVALGSLAMTAAALWLVPPPPMPRTQRRFSAAVILMAGVIGGLSVAHFRAPFVTAADRTEAKLVADALNGASPDEVRVSAQTLLATSPLTVEAFEALALTEEGEASSRAIQTGLTLSRRSGILPALQFQRALAEEDYRGAANDALLLLRRGENDAGLLSAVRIASLAPEFASTLGNEIDPAVHWPTPIFELGGDASSFEARGSRALLRAITPPDGGLPPHLVDPVIAALIANERPAEAVALYRELYPDRDPLMGAAYPNARSRSDNSLFDWRLGAPAGMRISHDLASSRLDIRSNGRAVGPIGWRYLALDPGAYRIEFLSTSSGRPMPVAPEVACINGMLLASPETIGRNRHALEFTIDDGCPLAVIRLIAREQTRAFRQSVRDWRLERLPRR